jgi:SagB-type dehydrogenase family enzyme
MSELDKTNYPAFIQALSQAALESEGPRRYPGYPTISLPRGERKWVPQSLEKALLKRRRMGRLPVELPPAKSLAHVLRYAHSVCAEGGRGPTPSAGGLQALELYLLSFGEGWLAPGGYHYDRAGHLLTSHFSGAERCQIEQDWVPSLSTVEGGSLVWILVGDLARVEQKYTHRASQFLLLEAGHLMQNLCLLCPTVPLGAFFEQALKVAFRLRPTDLVLYAGIS